METLIVTAQQIATILNKVGINNFIDQVIKELEQTLVELNPDKTQIRKRDGFLYFHPYPGTFEWMPVKENNTAIVKMVSYNPNNPTLYSIPTIVSTICQYDLLTGHLIALIDGVIPTAIRTGAASAVASRVFAKHDSSIIGLVGCGSQAVTQLHALSRVFNLKETLIYDIDPQASASFAERVNFINNIKVKIVTKEVLEENSDIICTATSVPINGGPVIDGVRLKKYVHINAIGSDLPGKTELPLELLKRSFVCPDFIEQAKIEGECQQLAENEYGCELSDVLKNRSEYYKFRQTTTVFDSTGFAIEDKVIMDILVQLAKTHNEGTYQQIESLLANPKNPYSILNIKSPPIPTQFAKHTS